ncbi:aspartate racemase [bacterium 336/3]|nr:aspartate racemase [bacterium 336/3]
MKILGLVGGISWVSTTDYYKLINQGVNNKLGDLNFSECIIYSLNYQEIKNNNDRNDWDATFQTILKACKKLSSSGANAILLCANTMHHIADRLEKELDIPIIHIADATALEIEKVGLKKVGLLGTKFTMELDFFKSRLLKKGIETIIPDETDRAFLHQNIFEELGRGIFKEESKKRYLEIIDKLLANGAEGIILGCTEIPMLLPPQEVPAPAFDTTLIHTNVAIEFQLS